MAPSGTGHAPLRPEVGALKAVMMVVSHGVCIAKRSGIFKKMRAQLAMLKWDRWTLKLEFYATKSAIVIVAIRAKLLEYDKEGMREICYLHREATAHGWGGKMPQEDVH
ncbi:hypothetical protein NDU88_005278 [Pleurodeles waltl]|uniref:Uncharacterized protein n=1 Tax=Pleurodeles waltl TaxID=8319 RepID=A0AAV7MX07_PLEWA|nr:hypothetical protein NDU88_005278 [Pleurodeles waltl]